MSTIQVAPDTNTLLSRDAIPVDPQMQEQLLRQEKFMSQVVKVYVHPSANENDPPHFILNVNGINQPVFRGTVTPMRRCFLEVLARMKETKYSQNKMDFSNPERSNTIIPRTAQVYPFEVVEDPNPAGRAWLTKILQEAA